MEILSINQIKSTGKMMLIYSDTGIGKTTSIIQSAPCPILYVCGELRNVQPSIDAANRPDLDMDIALYSGWIDMMKTLSDFKKLARYKTIVVDSFSHLMNIGLSTEITNEAFNTKSDKEQKKKPLVNSAKMSIEGYGGLAGQMFRLCRVLCQLSSMHGKVIICTALLAENPRYDRELAAAPALKGKEFPQNMPGFFDLIGLVKKRTREGKTIYPPMVFFESQDNDFLCKFTGVGEKRNGPLNLSKILGIKD